MLLCPTVRRFLEATSQTPHVPPRTRLPLNHTVCRPLPQLSRYRTAEFLCRRWTGLPTGILQVTGNVAQAAGLVDVLDATSSAITVFAPTDDAFAALADALHLTPEELLSKSDLLSVVSSRLARTALQMHSAAGSQDLALCNT